jgi:transcriptional regulator with XRE-family HTH domain
MTIKAKYFGSKSLERRLGPMTIGSFLKSWRLSENLSQQEFSKLIGMSSANLCDIEKGRKGVSPRKAAEIAEAIGYSPVVLVEIALTDLLRQSNLKFDVSVKEHKRRLAG